MISLAKTPTDLLHGMQECLEASDDPSAPLALSMVKAEVRLRYRPRFHNARVVRIPSRLDICARRE